MLNRKMKQLALAVGAALGGLSVLPSAEAVSVSSDNLGQVLIFPYYTVRAGWNTLFGITNTSDRVVATKVRFRESYNSRDVFDFNIILSPYDMWTGTLSEGGSGPVLTTGDVSCTVGVIPAAGQSFTTTAYSATTPVNATDGGPTGVDRLRDGYIEVIMMGAAVANTTNALAAGAIHGAGGAAPSGCGALVKAFTTATDASLAAVRAAFPEYIPSPLKGTFALVNAQPGKGFNAVGLPTALNNFRTTPFVTLQVPPAGQIDVTESGYDPTLAAATTQGVYYNASTDQPVPGAANGVAAVTDALVQTSVLNEWSRKDKNPAVATDWTTTTDWVVTMPTKAFYVDGNTTVYGARATGRVGLPAGLAPFTEAFGAPGQSCDPISVTLRDREEQSPPVTTSPFSPWVVTSPPELCYEANVITFNAGALLANPNSLSIQGYPATYKFGWMQIDFSNGPLPAIGFAITSRDTGGTDALLSEAALYDHSYIRPVR